MKLFGACLVVAALLGLALLLLLPVYVTPGNGHISCGRPWRVAVSELPDLNASCARVVHHRRQQLFLPIGGIVVGALITIVGGRRREGAEPGGPDLSVP